MKNAFLCTLVVMILLTIHGQAYGHADGKCIFTSGIVYTISHTDADEGYFHKHISTSEDDGSTHTDSWTKDTYDLAVARMSGPVTDEDEDGTHTKLTAYYDCYSVDEEIDDEGYTVHKERKEDEEFEYENSHNHFFSHQHISTESPHSHFIVHYDDKDEYGADHNKLTSHTMKKRLIDSGHEVNENDPPPPPPPPTETMGHNWEPPETESTRRVRDRETTDTTTEPVKEVKEEVKIPEPVEPPPPVIPKQYAEFQFYKGINFFSMPLYLDGINTIADLWNKYQFLQLNGLIYVLVDNCWLTYNGQEDQVAGDIPLTPYTALALSLISPSLVGMRGVPYELQETLELTIGANLIAFPVLPKGVVRPSDLIALGAENVLVTIKGKPYLIAREGDTGDEPISPNHGLLVTTQNPIVLEFLIVSAAPAATKKKTLITSWAKQKMKD